jgi:protein-S-isoprenylcysteine O-methyltransferase Ste14
MSDIERVAGDLAAIAALLLAAFQIVEGLGTLTDPGPVAEGLQDGNAALNSASGWWHLTFGVLVLAVGLTVLVACARAVGGER